MPPVIIGGAIAAAGAIGGSVIASNGAKSAAKATQQAADQSAQLQRETYQDNKATLAPYVATGLPATGAINSLLGLSGDPNAYDSAFDNYRNSTGYDFRLGQGMDAVNSGFAGRGVLQSGAAMKSLNDYGQGMASAEFGNYLGALGNQQGLGFSAASAQAGVGQNYANSLGNIYQAQGNNLANASLVKSQNTAGALNSLAGIGGNILGQQSYRAPFNPSASMVSSAANTIASNPGIF